LDREEREREREREKARAQVYIHAKTGPLVMLDCYVEVALLVKEEKDY
jgi:hypothetical protein